MATNRRGKCLHDGNKAVSCGVCRKCLDAVNEDIRNKTTTRHEAESQGRILPMKALGRPRKKRRKLAKAQ